MSIAAMLLPKGVSGFGYGSTAEEVTEGITMHGRSVLLTGCNSGIGLASAQTLAKRGARILMAARSVEKARAAIEACGQAQGELVPVACELSDPASVRACIKSVRQGPKLDVIICNAGIMALPQREQAFGYELQFFTNHIGHFMLVTGLLDHLAADARVVVVSSGAHSAAPKCGVEFDNLSGEKHYAPWTNYGQSKLANILFAKELSRRLGDAATANALHPGVIKTKLARSMSLLPRLGLSLAKPVFLKTPQQGAATQCYLATHPGLAGVSGQYFSDCNVARPSVIANNQELAGRLWSESERIVASLT